MTYSSFVNTVPCILSKFENMDLITSSRVAVTLSALAMLCCAFHIYSERRRHKIALMRKKRRRQRETQMMFEASAVRKLLPNMEDPKEQQSFILHEIQAGETLMGEGRFEKAVVHFACAIAVCAAPDRLVVALRESLPPAAFDLLLKILANDYGRRFLRGHGKGPSPTARRFSKACRY